jgi:ATP-dependent DNA helicase PIF1
MGVVDDESKTIIESRCIKYKNVNGIVPTILYATNAKVNKKNKQQYDKLPGPEMSYKTIYSWKMNVYNKEKYENCMLGPHEIKLKVGAQVMFLLNREGLFNGSRGVVVDFMEGFPMIKFTSGETVVVQPEMLSIEEGDQVILEYSQLPLKLAWSATIHKSQGTTLDLVKIDFKHIFEQGQFYVALSRVRTLEGLFLKNLDWRLLKVNPKAVKFYKKINC